VVGTFLAAPSSEDGYQIDGGEGAAGPADEGVGAPHSRLRRRLGGRPGDVLVAVRVETDVREDAHGTAGGDAGVRAPESAPEKEVESLSTKRSTG
jgi:hypothetical protein